MDDKKGYREKILRLKNAIIKEYIDIYYNYELVEQLELEDKKDITLDFVSCTICKAKNNLLKDIIQSDYIMVQPCLRNNIINCLCSDTESVKYMGFFTMIGGFHYIKNEDYYIDEFNEIVLRQFKFFRKISSKSDIRLTIPIQYKKYIPLNITTINELKENNCDILYSIDDEENLKWKYGISNIIGYGTRWEVKNIKGEYVNCGNDVLLYDIYGKPVGVDFGSGLETLISLFNGENNLLYSNIVCDEFIYKFCHNDLYNEKLINSITSLICCEHYKKIKTFRVNYLITCYIRIISAICIINNISKNELEQLFNRVEKNVSLDETILINKVIEKIIEQKNFLEYLSLLGKNAETLYDYEYIYSIEAFKLFKIEKYAIDLINKKEEKYVKTKKIEKRR